MNQYFDELFNNEYNLHYKVDCNGHLWFYADEIARYLGYSRARNMKESCSPLNYAVLSVDNPVIPYNGLVMDDYRKIKSESCYQQLSVNGGMRRFIVINENGLYEIINNSRINTPPVVRFKAWVNNVLLQTVRTANGYLEQEEINKLQSEQDYGKELAIRMDGIIAEKNAMVPAYIDQQVMMNNPEEYSCTVKDLSCYLNNMGIRTNENKLYNILHNDSFLIKQRGEYKPSQSALDSGLFTLKFDIPNKRNIPVLTFAGARYFVEYYRENFTDIGMKTMFTDALGDYVPIKVREEMRKHRIMQLTNTGMTLPPEI